MTLFPNSMYSVEQEMFWSLMEEHIAIQEQKRRAGALYDFELILQDKNNQEAMRRFWQQHRGRSFRLFRPEVLLSLVNPDIESLDDAFPIPMSRI